MWRLSFFDNGAIKIVQTFKKMTSIGRAEIENVSNAATVTPLFPFMNHWSKKLTSNFVVTDLVSRIANILNFKLPFIFENH